MAWSIELSPEFRRDLTKLGTEEAKRIVLKDLFRLYNNYNIIDLDEDEYDRFISYLNIYQI